MKRRPIYAVASITGALTLAISSCGSNSTTSAESAEPIEWSSACNQQCQSELAVQGNALDATCTIGISQNALDNPYAVAQKDRLELAARQNFPNMTVISTDGQHDAVTQSSQIRDLITRGIDVLVITPLEADALAPAVKYAMEQNVDVVAHDRAVNTDVTSFIGANNIEAGEVAANKMVEDLGPEGGAIVEIQGSLGASAQIDRHQGLLNVLAKNPQATVVADQVGDWSRGDARQAMQDVLQRFGPGQIDAVFAHNDEMALGASQAIGEAGRNDEIAIYSFDGQNSAFEAIRDGAITSTVIYPLDAPEAIAAAGKVCLGETIPESIKLESILVTKDNVDQYLNKGF